MDDRGEDIQDESDVTTHSSHDKDLKIGNEVVQAYPAPLPKSESVSDRA